MSTTTPTMPPAAPVIEPWVPGPLYRMTVDQYEAMAASGGIPESHRVHLINGLLVQKMTINPPHAISSQLCRDELGRVIPAGWHVRPSLPARLPAQASEPEPDLGVVRGTVRDYEGHHPGPADIALLVEVADSSLPQDRKLGEEVYGPAGVPVYWIIDVNGRQVLVHTGPGARGYAAVESFGEGREVPVVIDGREVGRIAVEDLLPRRRAAAGEGE